MPTSLLLACLSSAPDPALSDRLSQLSESDWQALLQVATRHGILPLLYHRLTSASPVAQSRSTHHQSPASVPHSAFFIAPSLLEAFLLNAARNALLYQDLAQVLTRLQSHGIRVAVLKGAHLAALVYPHIGLRPMADIDLLLPRDQLLLADATLRILGYTASSSLTSDSPAGRLPTRNPMAGKHLPEYFKPPGHRIEIHWTIAEPSLPLNLDPDALQSRLRSATIAGVPTHVLAPEDFLLYQCTHLAGHRFFCHGLRPLCDLATTLQHHRHDLDWSQLQSRAREWNAEPYLYLALRLTSELLHVPLPPAILDALHPANFDEHYYEIARESILLAGDESASHEDVPELGRVRALADGVVDNSLAGRLRFLIRTAFPSREHMAIYMARFHALPLIGHRKYTCYLTRTWDLTGKGFAVLRYGATHRRETALHAQQLKKQAQLWRWIIGPDSPSAQASPSLPVSESPSTNHQSPPPSALCPPPPIPTSPPVPHSALPTRRSAPAPASLSSSPEERAGMRSRCPLPPVPHSALRAPHSVCAPPSAHWFDWPWPIRWALLLTYLGLVTWMSLMPASTIARFPMPFHFRYEDKVVHFLFYGGLVAFGRWTLAAHWTIRPTVWPVVVGAIGYGALMEILQSLIVSYGRSFEFGDIAANTCGALSFWWLSRFLFRPHPSPLPVPT